MKKSTGISRNNGLVMHEFFISGDCLHELDVLKDLKVTSLDVPIDEDGESTLADLLPGVNNLEENTVKKLSITQFWELLNDILLPAESEIVKLFYLDGQTVSQIAEHGEDATEIIFKTKDGKSVELIYTMEALLCSEEYE